MGTKRDLRSEVRLLERSYARGEISWEELIARKRDLLFEKSRIPLQQAPVQKSRKQSKIDIKNKGKGILTLLVLTVLSFIVFVYLWRY